MITHRFREELIRLEREKIFCNRNIELNNRVLVIGTFNPDNQSYPVESNNAEWFYGRIEKNKFWRYFPLALTGNSLHPLDGNNGGAFSWKEYCTTNRVVIIDMLKSIDHDLVLTSQKDGELEFRISEDLSNVSIFNIVEAFHGVTFEKVLYSLKWSDARNLPKLVEIRDGINRALLEIGVIRKMSQIKYCTAPWRNDAGPSWNNALAE